LDAFGSENIPYHLATREFLQAVRKALAPGGVVLGNVWSRGSNPLYESMVRTYQDVFEELYICDVPRAGNEILVALPRKERIDRSELARRAGKLSKERQFRFSLGDAVEYGFRRPGENESGGRVLTDKDKPKPSD
jgi:spermidine synthase